MANKHTLAGQMLAALILALYVPDGWATEGRGGSRTAPTLARLSFWVPPARMAEFEAAYREKVVPILNRHGLVESSERGRATPDSVFSRLFELKTPGEVADKQKALQGDSTWTAMLRDLGVTFGIPQPDGLIRNAFTLYSTPAGPGKAVPAGPGKKVPAGLGQGHLRTYGVSDGLADGFVRSVFQDRNGYLWFGTTMGATRYDGTSFTTFTAKDGLANNIVQVIFQDREGYLWFGTWGGGISRYDGLRFTTFATKDNVYGNYVLSILQDRKGYLWFGTYGGVSRYDGQRWATFTTKDGLTHNHISSIFQDREGYLWFGTLGGGISRYNGNSFTTFSIKDGLANNVVQAIFQDREGYLWFGTLGGGMSRYDGRKFITFTTRDGLADNTVRSIFQDRDGLLWFGTIGGGVSRYDGKSFAKGMLENRNVLSIFQDQEGHLWFGGAGDGVSRYDNKTFTTFTTQDGLTNNTVESMFQDRERHLWFGTWGGGVSRYDGEHFVTFTTQDGLAGNKVRSILQDREGLLWFGTEGGGVSRYDGKTFTTFTTQDGLANDHVHSIMQDRNGYLWFGTWGGGLSRYDGKTFITFTTQDRLASDWLSATFQDREGYLWFGTDDGVSRYDGKTFTTFTTRDGLAHNWVRSIFQDREGYLWFDTFGGGVSRYHPSANSSGQSNGHFTTFTTQDGLAHNVGRSILQDREGHLWFGTIGGGVSRYDGQVFQTMLQEDGLANNSVISMLQDREGYLWFGTGTGITRYRPPVPSPPPVFIDAVVTDRRHEKLSELSIPSTVKLTAFEFHAISFKTRPEAMVYRYRLKGYDKEWQNTHARRVEYQDLPIGTYTFEVQAVDRDLVYSEKPATVRLTIHPPYQTIALACGLGLALVGAAMASGYAVKRRRERDRSQRDLIQTQSRLMEEMEKELQTAHEMQMSLMPKEPPRIEEFDIAGRCVPANHVGGDYFQYFSQDGKLTLALADVTGHAMEAAIPVVMFSGILESHMELVEGIERLFGRLNRSLHRVLTGRTFICFVLGEFDLSTRSLRLSNGACPCPYHFRAESGEVIELQVEAYPLGVRPDTEYPVVETQLQAGDRVVFCSDGIAEAVNAAGEQFGYERTTKAIRGACEEGLSAEATINRILSEVNAFRGNAPQADDMTCVVVRVEKAEGGTGAI